MTNPLDPFLKPKMGLMSAAPVSSEQIRLTLSQIKDRTDISVDTAQADRIASTLRDAFIKHEGDPGNKDQLFGAMVASWCSLKVAMLSPIPGVVASLWVQTEVLRRMVDGEIPVLTIEDMLGLGDLEDLTLEPPEEPGPPDE